MSSSDKSKKKIAHMHKEIRNIFIVLRFLTFFNCYIVKKCYFCSEFSNYKQVTL